MGFIKGSKVSVWKPDAVFSIMKRYRDDIRAHGKEGTTNAIIGSLCDENGDLVTYNTVFDSEKEFPNVQRAAYPVGLKGNPHYISAMNEWILNGNYKGYFDGIATVGGSGAVFVALDMCLDKGETILLPEIAWGSYQLMANEFNFKVVNYDVYDIEDMLNKAEEVIKVQKRLVLVINSPCQNPCGNSLDIAEWQRVVEKLNELTVYGEVVLVNDIAYIDYAKDPIKAREYFKCFNDFNNKVLTLVCASTSKSFSYYGQRLGELIILSNDEKVVDAVEKAAELKVRCTWSTCNHVCMSNIAKVLNERREEYIEEKRPYIDLIYKRADLFVKEAKEVGLPIYEFKEGFFITIKIEDETKRDTAHEKLLDNYIYTVKTVKGIRVAICSMPVKEIEGLAKKIKDIID